MSVGDCKKLSSIYRIEDGIIYYNYYGRIYSREVCPEIVKLLTTRRRIYMYKEYRMLVALYENEMCSINSYILGWDKKFKLQKPYPTDQIIRGVGKIDITVNSKKI